MKGVKLSNKEILLISQAIQHYLKYRLSLGVPSLLELNKLYDVGNTATKLLEKLAEAVPNE